MILARNRLCSYQITTPIDTYGRNADRLREMKGAGVIPYHDRAPGQQARQPVDAQLSAQVVGAPFH